jgi:citrate synthase
MNMTAPPAYSPGLEGVIAGTTQICTINPETQTLLYRGYDIQDIIRYASFEETAYLLLFGELPTQDDLIAFTNRLIKERVISPQVIESVKQYPRDTHPMDALKAACAMEGLFDAEKNDDCHEANMNKAIRIIAKMPALTAAFSHAKAGTPLPSIDAAAHMTHAEYTLYMLQGKEPDTLTARIFNATLVIYAEHSFNASTFSARVTTSTLSDIYSGVVAAIGTLKGSLHGGANEEVMKTLLEVKRPENVDAWLETALAEKRKIMGFGHRAYKNGDPRAFLLRDLRQEFVDAVGQEQPWPAIADRLEALMHEKKGLYPNVDYHIGYLYYMMGLPMDVYTPIFAIGRAAGWTAHVVEQLANNRLIRPKALYEGEPQRPWPANR